MLESRRCYGYGMVSPTGYGYDYIIKKDGYSATGGSPCKTQSEAMRKAKKFIRECDSWKGAEVEIIPYRAYKGY